MSSNLIRDLDKGMTPPLISNLSITANVGTILSGTTLFGSRFNLSHQVQQQCLDQGITAPRGAILSETTMFGSRYDFYG